MGIFLDGEMVEWFKAAVLKTAEVQASASSNLALSAIFLFKKNGERRRTCHGVARKGEDVSLLFTVRSTTSLKTEGFLPCHGVMQ